MDYKSAIEYIQSSQKFGSRLGLGNIGTLLGLMGDPHKKLRFIHVAGTNGKGSTVAFISNILAKAGYRTGAYISPYIERFNERIKVDNEDISDSELAELTDFVKEKITEMVGAGHPDPTEFEIVTAIGFEYFLRRKCDVVVLEVGMGGRFDATNIIGVPDLAVITTISYDHMDRLGDTLELIAGEKAGIIKSGGDVLIYPQPENVDTVFTKVCAERGAKKHGMSFGDLRPVTSSIDGQVFDYKDLKDLRINLLGPHQLKNAALAAEAAILLATKGYHIGREDIREGLAAARWPGRFEILRRRPMLIIDGAHNSEGAETLAMAIKSLLPGVKVTFVFGVLKDRDYMKMLRFVFPVAESIITVTTPKDMARTADELAEGIRTEFSNVSAAGSIRDAYEKAVAITPEDGVICAFGSLYYIGRIRGLINK